MAISPQLIVLDSLKSLAHLRGCAACLDVIAARKLVDIKRIHPGTLVRIVNIFMRMLKRFSGPAELPRKDEAIYAREHE